MLSRKTLLHEQFAETPPVLDRARLFFFRDDAIRMARGAGFSEAEIAYMLDLDGAPDETGIDGEDHAPTRSALR